MSISRRNFIVRGGASMSALAFLRAMPGNAAEPFRPGFLPSEEEMWSDVQLVNYTMGPSRLTGSWQHEAYVEYLKDQLTSILKVVGGSVFEDTFANYPRWTATSWALFAGSQPLPVSSYFPYC